MQVCPFDHGKEAAAVSVFKDAFEILLNHEVARLYQACFQVVTPLGSAGYVHSHSRSQQFLLGNSCQRL